MAQKSSFFAYMKCGKTYYLH